MLHTIQQVSDTDSNPLTLNIFIKLCNVCRASGSVPSAFFILSSAFTASTAASEEIFRSEWRGIIDQLRVYPSIVMWVPFNEAWGQFKTPEIAAWTKAFDPSRLVDAASGGNHYPGAGDVFDIHAYPHPRIHTTDNSRPLVLGEYGGIGLALEGHLWQPDRNWGYVQYKTPETATDEYVRYAELLRQLVVAGVAGAIYTQTTDVEIEVNGVMTYDRAVVKLDPERVRQANAAVLGALDDF